MHTIYFGIYIAASWLKSAAGEKLSTRVIHMYPVRSVPEAVISVTRNNSYTPGNGKNRLWRAGAAMVPLCGTPRINPGTVTLLTERVRCTVDSYCTVGDAEEIGLTRSV